MKFFEAMPNMLFFDRFLFVHAGIPKDRDLKEQLHRSLVAQRSGHRFQMLWSDPATADAIPADLQDEERAVPVRQDAVRSRSCRSSARTMVRGHEKVNAGFLAIYDDHVVADHAVLRRAARTTTTSPETQLPHVTPWR